LRLHENVYFFPLRILRNERKKKLLLSSCVGSFTHTHTIFSFSFTLPSCFLLTIFFSFLLILHKTFSFSRHPDSHICFFFFYYEKNFFLFIAASEKFFFLLNRIEKGRFFMIQWAWCKKQPLSHAFVDIYLSTIL
jgi:hypothetical protein